MPSKLPSNSRDDSVVQRILDAPMQLVFLEIPTREHVDKLTDHASRKYNHWMDLIEAGKAELEQMKAATIEKIAINENVMPDL